MFNISMENINWPLIVFVILTFLFLCYFYFKLYFKKNKILFFLRFIFLIFLLVIFFRPKINEYKKNLETPNIAILVDKSYSMNAGLKDTRLAGVIQFLSSNKLNLANRKYNFLYYTFSNSLKLDSYESIINSRYLEPFNTDFSSCLELLKKDINNKNIKAAILFSDGKDTSNRDMENILDKYKLPIYTIFVDDTLQKDLSITADSHSYLFYKGITGNIRCSVHSFGYLGKKINVYLKRGKKIEDVKSIIFNSDEQNVDVEFVVSPREKGEIEYTVEIDKLDDELSYSNNSVELDVFVREKAVRILYLCGKPSSEYRFLRGVLKSDPGIELVSFIILRNILGVQPFYEDELSLIPFPEQEIFTKELFNFDILILEDFMYKSLLRQDYLDSINSFVKDKGGVMLVIAGAQTPNNSVYKTQVFSDLLPVYFDSQNLFLKEKTNKFILDNYANPLTFLDENENKRVWDNLPKLEGIANVIAKQNAKVLASTFVQDRKIPFLIFQKKGNGLVFFISSNSTWRWSFDRDRIFKTNYHQKFWLNLIENFNLKDTFSSLIVEIDKSYLTKRNAVRIIVKPNLNILDAKQIEDVEIRVVDRFSNIDTFTRKFDKKYNEYEFFYSPKFDGAYKIYASLKSNGDEICNANETCVVLPDSREIFDMRSDEFILQKIANLTKARFYKIDDENIKIDRFLEDESILLSQKDVWNNVYILLGILILFIVELIIRRKKGLL